MKRLLTFNDFHKYQVSVVAMMIRIRYGLLAVDTGLGKTIMALTIYDQLKKRGLLSKMLVIAPKRVVFNVWRQEAKNWKHTCKYRFSIIHGEAHSGPAETSRKIGLYTDADIYLTTYETLPWLGYQLHAYLDRTPLPWQMVVYDESTKLKHTNTQRFKRWKPFVGKFRYRIPMSGTPMPNGIQDLFGQMYLADLGQSLGATVTSFRSRFLERIPSATNFAMYKERPGARDEIAKRISGHAFSLSKEDYLDMPPLIYNRIGLELPKKLRKMYDEFERDFYIELDDIGIEAFNSGALSMKLRQFLQGFAYVSDDTGGQSVKTIHSEKIDLLKEMIESGDDGRKKLVGMGNTILVYYFRHERYMLLKEFPGAPFIDGGSKMPDTEKAIADWNDKKVPLLLANSASLNYGLNLQDGGNNILWYTMTWNAEHFSQLIDRLWRQRQTKPVFVHLLYFKDTVEEDILEAVTKKNASQKDLLNAIKQRRRQ